MNLFRLILKNAFRHRLRTVLTILGIAVAILAFGVLRTMISAWYAGVESAPPDRLITRSKISITFTLPLAQKERIERIPGVQGVTFGTWFGGVYKDPKNFFAQMAMEGPRAFDFYPEYLVEPEAMEAYGKERNAAIVGTTLARRFGWKVGDTIRLTGTIYPGDWDFVIRGIYRGRDETTDESTFFFRWDCIDERMREESPGRAGEVGWWVIKIEDPARAATICKAVDSEFDNSADETLTETEAAFQQSFVAMSGTIIAALQIISALVIGIILLVAANTMAMTARERISEYAVMKTLGFGPGWLFGLILGESCLIAVLGGLLGAVLLVPVLAGVGVAMSAFFPAFIVDNRTYVYALAAAALVGVLASIFPSWRAARVSIVDGLRRID